MMLDRDVPVSTRVDALHITLVPGRTQLPMLQMADRVLSRNKEEQLWNGLIESIFDFRLWWFGTDSRISSTPAWSTASVNTLRFAARMAEQALARSDLTSELRPKVSQSREAILRILNGAGGFNRPYIWMLSCTHTCVRYLEPIPRNVSLNATAELRQRNRQRMPRDGRERRQLPENRLALVYPAP
jgi:hypothetical protein